MRRVWWVRGEDSEEYGKGEKGVTGVEGVVE